MSKFDIRGKVALVTGAAQGLGFHIAQELASLGMKVAALDVMQDLLEDRLREIEQTYGVETLSLTGDVADETDVTQAVGKVTRTFGDIYSLVNNAGVRLVAPVWEVDTDDWDLVQRVNLRGSFLCAREVLRQSMRKANEGRLVFVSSVAGKRGAKHSAAYCATKWGILGLAHSVAQDLKSTNIRVSSITPGRTDTPMARGSEQWDPALGWLDPSSIAKAVAFCIQQESSVVIPELHLHHSAEL